MNKHLPVLITLLTFGSFELVGDELNLRCECDNKKQFNSSGYYEKACKGLISVKIKESIFTQSFTVIDGVNRNIDGKTTFGENFIEWSSCRSEAECKNSSSINSFTLDRNGLVLSKSLFTYSQQGGILDSSIEEYMCYRVDGL